MGSRYCIYYVITCISLDRFCAHINRGSSQMEERQCVDLILYKPWRTQTLVHTKKE